MMAATMTDQLASASGQLSGSGTALNQLGTAYYPAAGYPSSTADYNLARESRYDAHYSGRAPRQPAYQPHPREPLDSYYRQEHQSLGNLHSGGRYPSSAADFGAPPSGPHQLNRYGEPMYEPRAGSMPPGLDAGLGVYNPLEDPLVVSAPLSAAPPAPSVYPQQASGYRSGAPTGGRNDAMVAELRARLQEAQNSYVLVKRELDTATQKLGSSMHSIKSFWSPELKKERALRKEEATKYALINDQMKLMRVEVQVSLFGVAGFRTGCGQPAERRQQVCERRPAPSGLALRPPRCYMCAICCAHLAATSGAGKAPSALLQAGSEADSTAANICRAQSGLGDTSARDIGCRLASICLLALQLTLWPLHLLLAGSLLGRHLNGPASLRAGAALFFQDLLLLAPG